MASQEIHLVTGNPNKHTELKAIFPADISLHATRLDLPEIQSLNAEEIIEDKLQRAYKALGKAVIVEDVSAELDSLNGLPGPFIKYFEERLGPSALYILAGEKESGATIRCTMGYFDGQVKHIVDGNVRGKVVAPRGKSGFGFDVVFVTEGQTKTNAELSEDEKNRISHRALAIQQLVERLS